MPTDLDLPAVSVSLDGLDTLTDLACAVLNEPDCYKKAALTLLGAQAFKDGQFQTIGTTPPPLTPARPDYVTIVAPGHTPSRGKGGSEANRIKMLHSLAHIESVAIDLSWDLIARYADVTAMPAEFYHDWVIVAEDEARHYTMLCNRLNDYQSKYGDHPAHDGLWQSATETNHSLLARLVVVHCVHEARGLDVTPKTINKFRGGGDSQSATMLETILSEEITHVTAGMKWFTHLVLCAEAGVDTDSPIITAGEASGVVGDDLGRAPVLAAAMGKLQVGGGDGDGDGQGTRGGKGMDMVIRKFHDTVRLHFHGPLKPPFNHQARRQAGMSEEWYVPLTQKQADPVTTTITPTAVA